MDDGQDVDVGPPLESIEPLFAVSEVAVEDDAVVYYGRPLCPPEPMMAELWGTFREAGYEARLTVRHGDYAVVAEPTANGIDGIPWTNVALFLATVCSTLFVGSGWYGVDPFAEPTAIWRAWPFTVAVLGVLGVHEMGHYVASRYHGVDASLPYFLPVPTLIGTMGAVITIKSRMPDRRALFDIGVAGPLAGLVATVVVTAVGLHLEPTTVPQGALEDPDTVFFEFGQPWLLEGIAWAVDQPLHGGDETTSVNPVVIGGWVGMFVTFLNLIPVGQLDGGHVLRAITREYHETVASLVPAALFGLAGYLVVVGDHRLSSVTVWLVWGFFSLVLAYAGSATPVDDAPLGRKRIALGLLTFVLGALCFMAVPVAIVE